jgi:hypothetical protein
LARPDWRFQADGEVAGDLRELERWARDREGAIEALDIGDMALPGLRHLASAIETELTFGSGVAWVQQMPEVAPLTLRLAYLALGLCMGKPIGAYGRLYDVRDSGRSYRTEAIPVSQTRESTGVHTDSSNKEVCPRWIGLLCVRPAPEGGGSRITNVLETHERLAQVDSESLELLYQPFIRDLVTPGAVGSRANLLRNCFPIFSEPPNPRFRYMRYWIERGHLKAGVPLLERQIAALDQLDRFLEHPEHVFRFRMERGHMMFCDNTTVAHDRDEYVDDPANPRWLCRLWLADPNA